MNKYNLLFVCILSCFAFQSWAELTPEDHKINHHPETNTPEPQYSKTQHSKTNHPSSWLLIDNFENANLDTAWQKKDTRNDTSPYVPQPQVTNIVKDGESKNHFLIKKPAAKGVVGNRKALTYRALPRSVAVGETYTFFTRINIESFPNNHVFGLSNLDGAGIEQHDYNALEPSIRVTDKRESNGFKNDGTLMVKIDKGYSNIQHYDEKRSAKPAQANIWYNLWYVVNNATVNNGGQTYDVYVQGGEFVKQTLVYKQASFRMKRELPLISFMMNCNTGPAKKPYGNGGLRYDDLYMAKGILLSSPVLINEY